MSETESQIDTDAAHRILDNLGPETDEHGLRKSEDGVAYHHKECSRWQKYGHDRLYFNDGSGGYIDLEDGAVKGDTPVTNVEVEHGRVVYYATDIDHEYPIASRPL